MRCTFEPYEGPEKYVFVSYSHRDGEIIAGILEALNDKGFRIWYDEGIEWGTEWPESIAKHLYGCAVVMAFHSKTSVESRNCRQEINYALKCGKDILSVYLEEAKLSKGMDMQLSSYQSTYPYQYTNQEEFYMRLIKEPLIQNCRSDREAIKQSDDSITQPSVAKAQPIFSPDIKIENGVLVKYDGSGGDVVIPEGVTVIGKKAFSECANLIRVTIPNGVTTIDEYAFSSCKSLTSVIISEDVITIGKGAFDICHKLANITIPKAVTTIGDSAFCYCESLTSITIPESVTTINDHVFFGCKNLVSVTIPKSVIAIGKYAFFECERLTNVTIPEDVITIGESAFSGCKRLASVTIPENVTTIDDGAFCGCESLTSVIIPKSITMIGEASFLDCTGLTSVTIPKSVVIIDDAAFAGCSSLLKIRTPAQSYAHEYAKEYNIPVELI